MANDNRLSGQVALITGSTQGIGAGIAKSFSAAGARVVIHGLPRGRASANNQRATGELEILGDVADVDFCRGLVRQVVEELGRLDILVNNAASTQRSTIEENPVELWDRIMAINLRAPFILCQEAVRHMKARRAGCIINIGSVNAYVGQVNLMAYSVSKGGLMTLTKNLANALAPDGIRVNQINPGWTLTEGEHQVQSVTEGKGEKWLLDAVKTQPFGRLLSPEDIASAALFLAGASLITGAVLDYDQVLAGAPRKL